MTEEELDALPEPSACSDPSMIMTDEEVMEAICSRPKSARNLIEMLKGMIRGYQEKLTKYEALEEPLMPNTAACHHCLGLGYVSTKEK